MREILFRGKRNDDGGEWHYGGYIHDDSIEPDVHIIMEHRGGMFRCVPVLPETIGQYTGLTDKNGKKIFEGDILRYCGVQNVVVSFVNGQFVINHFAINLLCSRNADSEVIGNIHDNPELLEVSGDE